VFALRFSPDGRRLATAGSDNLVRLWDARTGQELHSLRGHYGMVLSVSWSPDGKVLASASAGGSVVATSHLTRTRPLPRVCQDLSRARLEALWDELGSADVRVALRAGRTLSASPAAAVPFLRERLSPVPPVPADKAARLLRGLNSANAELRELIRRELLELEELAVPLLREALTRSLPDAVREPVECLLREVQAHPHGVLTQRALRAVEVLARAGSADARAALAALARGAPGALLTEAAARALRPADSAAKAAEAPSRW
jgi:hypothetical protein